MRYRIPWSVHVLMALPLFGTPLSAAQPLVQASDTVAGRVVDATTGHPIQAAVVSTGAVHVVTGPDGRFRIVVTGPHRELRFERYGYRSKVMTMESGGREVALSPAPVLLESLVVQTRRGEMLASGTALSVHRVDTPAIQATAGTSLAEALDRWEGVSLSRVGSWGSRPVLRGLQGERVAVLIDGNRVSRACTFGMDQGLATVDPSVVERVEVLTGPGSAAYGSGNVGGVINVVTRQPERAAPLSFELRASGSSAVPGGGAGGTLRMGGDRYAALASLDAADYGDYRTAEGVVDGSGYRQLTGDLKLDLFPSPMQRLSVKGQRYEGRDIGWPMQGGAEIPRETRTSVSADYGWQRGGDFWDAFGVRAYFQELRHHMVMRMIMTDASSMAMTSLSDASSYSETSGGRIQFRVLPWSGAQVDVGGEVTHLLAEGTRWTERTMGGADPQRVTFHTWPGVRITDVGGFLQGEAAVGRTVTTSAGARLDRVDRTSDDGNDRTEWIVTGNAGVRLALGSWLTARGSVGLGYRTPDPMELYGLALRPDGFIYRGRPDLATERSVNVEGTLAAVVGTARMSATLFHNRLSDMVVPALAGDSVAGRPVREYRSLGDARIRGVSGSARAPLPGRLTATASATWTQGDDPETGTPLPFMPPLQASLTLRRDFQGALRWAEVEWAGAHRQDRVASSAGEPPTPGWGVLHVRGALEAGGARVTAGVENVFDRLYRGHLDPRTLYRPGRNVFVKVARSF